ncbi:uncharacterized protein FFNC_07100 [Fusarium fujikuroi]|nr:uncharacterized protein FFNC_07100 [Fusarium fujikuroi]
MTKTGGHFTLRISSTTHTRTQEHGFDYTFQRTHSTASLNDVAFDVFSIFPIETCLPLRVDFTRLTPMARKQTTLKAGKAGKSKTSRNVSSETKVCTRSLAPDHHSSYAYPSHSFSIVLSF